MTATKNRIVFFTGALSQPRIIRRIETLFDSGFQCKVYGYTTSIYTQNKISGKIETIELGSFRDGRDYISKFKKVVSNLHTILKKEKGPNTLFYSFDPKQALILAIYGVPFVYEISDIQYAYPKFAKIRPFLKAIERWIIKRSELTLMTSDGFRKWFKIDASANVLVQPNKLNKYFIGKRPSPKTTFNTDHLVFGFVGAPRSPETIGRFAKIVGEDFPQHEFLIFGESSHLPVFHSMLDGYPNVSFMGSFKNPEDLCEIYGKIDVVVSAYDTRALNERILDANKLYESIFFCKPVIMSDNTFSAEQVAKYGCGYSIDASSDGSIRDFIDNISAESLTKISIHESKQSESDVIDNSNELINKIESYFINR